MPVYKNAVVALSGGELLDAASKTVDCIVRLKVVMPTWDIDNDQPGDSSFIIVNAPEGYEIGTADIAEDNSYVTISFVSSGDDGGGGAT